MRKTIFLIVGLIMLIAGVVMAQVGSFQLADISGFAVTMFGAGLAAATLWSKKETGSKTWLCLLGVVAIGIGAFMLGFAGFAEATMTVVITSVFGVVAVILGVIASYIGIKQTK